MMISTKDKATYHPSFGGKAKGLFMLGRLGCRVPPFFVISSGQLKLPPASNSERITNAIEAYRFDAAFINEIISSIPGADFFAVRSSAVEEDGNSFSFAGQFESVLYVTKENLEQAIKKVWLSAYSERVKAYKDFHDVDSAPAMAIIVQQMIPAEVSGVAFGVHPVTGSSQGKIINAVFGAGEGLVSGELNADEYIISNGVIQFNIVKKEKQFIQDKNSADGTAIENLSGEKSATPTLTEKQIFQLCHTLDRLYRLNALHYDIEFAVYNDEIYYLQARPVTAVAKNDGQRIVWDNSNIIESYPGLTSPLTFSFITKMYEAVYRQFSLLMGVSKQTIEDSKDIYANMLGLLYGRVYYNLLSWYRALAKLPGYKINAAFMEKMMGVKERFELNEPASKKGAGDYYRLLKTLGGIIVNHNTLNKQRLRFLEHLDKTLAHYYSINWDDLDETGIVKNYVVFEQTLVKKWKAPLVNDFFTMIYFGLLQKLVEKYTNGKEPQLHNDLVSGAGDIVSTVPVTEGLKLADEIASSPELLQLFSSPDNHILPGLKKFPAFETKFYNYISQWGDRCVGELKLETITYRQQPELFVRILKSYLHADRQRLLKINKDAHNSRTVAEEKMRIYLKGKPFKKWLFSYVLKKARYLVSNRENLRFERTRGFGMVRIMFCALGKRLAQKKILENERDIFFLTQDEIFDFIKGAAVNINLKGLIAFRRNEYSGYEKITLPERIETTGMVYPAVSPVENGTKKSSAKKSLKGIGCCAGKVRAKVTVLKTAHEINNLNGSILVTASTDPGWVSLFPTCSGILVERGSLLSHSAIVSREMGIPCIVGVTGLLTQLKTGDEVEMDGASGEIKIISNESAA